MSLAKKISSALALSTALVAGSASNNTDARDIICNREVEVCVPCVTNVQYIRKVYDEVPVVCYQSEKRLVNRTFVEPTCDPCNPFVTRTCQQEIEVKVPYVMKQIRERNVFENVPVVQYHREKRIVPVVIHVDDCPQPCPSPCAPNACDPATYAPATSPVSPTPAPLSPTPVPQAPTPADPSTKPQNRGVNIFSNDKVADYRFGKFTWRAAE